MRRKLIPHLTSRLAILALLTTAAFVTANQKSLRSLAANYEQTPEIRFAQVSESEVTPRKPKTHAKAHRSFKALLADLNKAKQQSKSDTFRIAKEWKAPIPNRKTLYSLMVRRRNTSKKLRYLRHLMRKRRPGCGLRKTRIARLRHRIKRIRFMITKFHCDRKKSPYTKPKLPKHFTEYWLITEIHKWIRERRLVRITMEHEWEEVMPDSTRLERIEYIRQKYTFWIRYLKKILWKKYHRMLSSESEIRRKIKRLRGLMVRFRCPRPKGKWGKGWKSWKTWKLGKGRRYRRRGRRGRRGGRRRGYGRWMLSGKRSRGLGRGRGGKGRGRGRGGKGRGRGRGSKGRGRGRGGKGRGGKGRGRGGKGKGKGSVKSSEKSSGKKSNEMPGEKK